MAYIAVLRYYLDFSFRIITVVFSSSAGWAIDISRSKCCLFVGMLKRVPQIIANAHRDLWSCMHRPTMNPDHIPKIRQYDLLYGIKSPDVGKQAWICMFKPAERHSPWDVYYFIQRLCACCWNTMKVNFTRYTINKRPRRVATTDSHYQTCLKQSSDSVSLTSHCHAVQSKACHTTFIGVWHALPSWQQGKAHHTPFIVVWAGCSAPFLWPWACRWIHH